MNDPQEQVVTKKRMFFAWVLLGSFIHCTRECAALTSTKLLTNQNNNGFVSSTTVGRRHSLDSKLTVREKQQRIHRMMLSGEGEKEPCSVCPEEDVDEMDRREWFFASLGSLWSMGLVPSVVLPSALSSAPQAANAAYGDDAKLQLPNVMEGISNRVNKQCLAESLGNRECLVYMSDNPLYKGENEWANRLIQATQALETIPSYVEEKKWSAVLGVTTGPMGGLAMTLDQLAKQSNNPADASSLAKRVKNDLYEMAAAVERKNGSAILQAHAKATKDLQSFINTL